MELKSVKFVSTEVDGYSIQLNKDPQKENKHSTCIDVVLDKIDTVNIVYLEIKNTQDFYYTKDFCRVTIKSKYEIEMGKEGIGNLEFSQNFIFTLCHLYSDSNSQLIGVFKAMSANNHFKSYECNYYYPQELIEMVKTTIKKALN